MKQRILGLQPRFGGKAYDTWSSKQEAVEAAASGVGIAETL